MTMPTLLERGTSAFVGQPPNTERDYYIVRGILRATGLDDVDPAKGYIRAAQPPYPGYVYPSKQPGIIAGVVIIMIIIVVATVTRTAFRVSMTQLRFGADDWATIAAAAFGLAYTICQLQMALKGGGNHIWDTTYEDYNTFWYYGIMDRWMFYLTVSFITLSLALFIRRLARHNSTFWRWFCDFFIFTIVVYIGLAVFWDILACTPFASQWDLLYSGRLDAPAVCYNQEIQAKFFNITHVVQGVMLLTAPVIILWHVRMDRAKKTRLFVIWATGAVAVLCGLMRLIRADFSADLTWDYPEILIWTSLDIAIGIITISLPVLDAWLAGAWRDAVTRIGQGGGLGGLGGGSSGGRGRSKRSAGGAQSDENEENRLYLRPGGRAYGHGTTILSGRGGGDASSATSTHKHTHHYSESVEEMLHSTRTRDDSTGAGSGAGATGGAGDGPMEMKIFTTHEFDVRYSTASPGLGLGGQIKPAKGYDKRFVTGLDDEH